MPIIKLVKKNKPLSLFIFFQLISVVLLIYKDSFFLFQISEGVLSGKNSVQLFIRDIGDYFRLKEKNEELAKENQMLRRYLYGFKKKISNISTTVKDTTNYLQEYEFIRAKVVKNSLGLRDNFFVLDKGLKHGVGEDMGVITSDGVFGIILNSNNHYSRGVSVLSSLTKFNARLKRSKYFGTLIWDGKDSRTLQLTEIPRFVDISVGDTVETDGKSDIFPEGIPIGRVAGFKLEKTSGYWLIDVESFPLMGAVDEVYIVKRLIKYPKQIDLEQPNE